MKLFVWCGLLLALLAGPAFAGDPNTPGSVVTQATGSASGNNLYPAQPVGQSNPLWVQWSSSPLPTGASTSALQTTGNGFLQTLATASASQATSSNQATQITAEQTTATNSTTIAAAQGAQGTGSTFNPPAGGSGILGYLSGIYKALTGTLTVSDTNSAAFGGAVSVTPGTPFAAGRSIGFVCTTAGNITVTLSDTSTMTFPIVVSPSLQTLPLAATNITLGSGTAGTFWSLK